MLFKTLEMEIEAVPVSSDQKVTSDFGEGQRFRGEVVLILPVSGSEICIPAEDFVTIFGPVNERAGAMINAIGPAGAQSAARKAKILEAKLAKETMAIDQLLSPPQEAGYEPQDGPRIISASQVPPELLKKMPRKQ